jgi:translation initiation factor 2B subunit (eIF-2B alpha/beta/delta family)
MADDPTESVRAQKEQFRGQETEEQKAAVKAQREAKKAEKAMKKAAGAARTGTELVAGIQPPTTGDSEKPAETKKPEKVAASTPESQSLEKKPATATKDPLPLQVLSATAIAKAAGEDSQPLSTASAGESDVVAKSKALQGQLTEEQKAAVKAQRDAKKAEKAEKKAAGAARNESKVEKPVDGAGEVKLEKPAKASKKEPASAAPSSGTTPPFQPAVPPSPNPFRRTPDGLFPCVDEAAGGSGSNASFTAAALEVVPKTTDVSQSPTAAPKSATKRKPAPLLPQAAGEIAAKSAKNDLPSGTPGPRGAAEPVPDPAAAGNSEADFAEKEMANPLLRPVAFYTPSWNQNLVHHRVAELGLLTREFRVVGSNARTIAMIDALAALFQSIPMLNKATTWDSQLITHLYKVLEANENYLNHCRTLCQGMKYVMERLRFTLSSQLGKTGNATEGRGSGSSFLTGMEKASESSISTTTTTRSTPLLREPMRVHTDHKTGHTPKPYILNFLQELRETVLGGLNAISKEAVQRIKNGDIILTYGRSSSVEGVFLEAHEKKIEFSVIILDSAPLFEGRTFATRLQNRGITVVYGLLSAACLLANRCTKAFFGASTVLGSGDVVSRAGTAIVALAAKNVRKPVLILSETYKFTTSVWLLSLTGNEETRFLNEWSKTKNGVPVETGHFDLGWFPPRRQKPGEHAEGEVPASPTTMGKPFFNFPGDASPGAAPKQSPPPDGAPAFAGRNSGFPLQTTKAAAPLLAAKPDVNPTATPPPADITRYACTATAKTGQIVSDGYLYDITPRACIDFIITDGGILHPTGVAAAVRERDEREGRGKTRHF